MGLAGHMLVEEMTQRAKGELPAHFDADNICLKRGFDPNPKSKRFYESGDILGKPSPKKKKREKDELDKMTQQQLLVFANEHDLVVDKKMKVKPLRLVIRKALS